MQHTTHSQFGMVFGAAAVILGQKQGIIPSDVSGDFTALGVTAAMAVTIIYTAKFGSYYPDLDHHNSYITTRNIFTKILHRLIKMTGPYLSSHRSRLTHSLDGIGLTVAALWLVLHIALNTYVSTNYIDESILNNLMLKLDQMLPLVMISLLIGAWSHTASDLLTTEGSYLFLFSKKKISLVPGNVSIMGAKPLQSAFSTSSPWEGLVYSVSKIVFYALLAIIVIQTFKSSVTMLVG